MSEDEIGKMLQNHKADSWDDGSSQWFYDDETVPPLARLENYVDYCFEHYDVVSDTLDRDQIRVCIADWDSRRGWARYNTWMEKQTFGKRVTDSKHKTIKWDHYSLFVAEALVGVPPEEDNGHGWKATVRHELGHLIDYETHGESDGHGQRFKNIMKMFDAGNDGQHANGYGPSYFK